MNNSQVDLLLIEDTPGDARLIQERLKHSIKIKRMIHFSSGEEALECLVKCS